MKVHNINRNSAKIYLDPVDLFLTIKYGTSKNRRIIDTGLVRMAKPINSPAIKKSIRDPVSWPRNKNNITNRSHNVINIVGYNKPLIKIRIG
jgi:hypothetical protein